ncbi:hypothetical protein IQ255_17045 [Pleurocapsales cyanobacterium LEGE 10410]|nr:hypothetical protein [Pleurocapsales cyanobacterium LEGE 10410]
MTNNKTNRTIWKQIIYKTGVWLAAEIWLNIIGLDNIADYSEFIFARDLDLQKKNRRTVKIMEYPPQFCPEIDDFCPLPGTVTNLKDLASDRAKAEIIADKCQQLNQPCIKIVCSSVNI